MCTALSRRVHWADGVLKTQWYLKGRRTFSVQTPRTAMAFAQRPLCAPAEFLLFCRIPFAWLWRPQGDPTALFYNAMVTPSHGVFISMLKVLAVVWHSMQSYSVYLRCHFVAVKMLAIVLHTPRRSTVFLDAVGSPWLRCYGVIGVLQTCKIAISTGETAALWSAPLLFAYCTNIGWIFHFLASPGSWAGWFESHLVWNPDDRSIAADMVVNFFFI